MFKIKVALSEGETMISKSNGGIMIKSIFEKNQFF